MTRNEYEWEFEEFLDRALNDLDPDQYARLLDNIFDTVDLRIGEIEGGD